MNFNMNKEEFFAQDPVQLLNTVRNFFADAFREASLKETVFEVLTNDEIITAAGIATLQLLVDERPTDFQTCFDMALSAALSAHNQENN